MLPARETVTDFQATAMPDLSEPAKRRDRRPRRRPEPVGARARPHRFRTQRTAVGCRLATARPEPQLGWESCGWAFTDGASSVSVDWNGRGDAIRDPHVIANGSIPGSVYADHFAIVPDGPGAVIGFDDCVAVEGRAACAPHEGRSVTIGRVRSNLAHMDPSPLLVRSDLAHIRGRVPRPEPDMEVNDSLCHQLRLDQDLIQGCGAIGEWQFLMPGLLDRDGVDGRPRR